MDIESLIKFPATALVRGIFFMLIIPLMVVFPSHTIQKDIKLVVKGPRPYKQHISLTESQDRHSRLKSSKREHLFHPIILEAAKKYNVDTALVKAVIMAESSYNPMAISKKGARGLMQLMPATATALGVEDLFNPKHNVNAGVRYLKMLLNQFEGDPLLALAAYNAGSKKVRKYRGIPPFKATRHYLKKVIRYYKYYQKNNRVTS